MNNLSFGKHIKSARKKKNWTTERLAEMTSINNRSIQQIECGSRSTSLTVLIQLCNALEVTPQYLLSGDLNENLLDEQSEYIQMFETIIRLNKSDFTFINDMIKFVTSSKHNY